MGVLFRHGLLSKRDQDWIMSTVDKYPHAVLLSKNLDYEWTKANLSLHKSIGEDCMGQDYEKETHMYSCSKIGNAFLYFFYDREDYDKVCELEIAIDPQPFMMFLEGTILDKIFV